MVFLGIFGRFLVIFARGIGRADSRVEIADVSHGLVHFCKGGSGLDFELKIRSIGYVLTTGGRLHQPLFTLFPCIFFVIVAQSQRSSGHLVAPNGVREHGHIWHMLGLAISSGGTRSERIFGPLCCELGKLPEICLKNTVILSVFFDFWSCGESFGTNFR